jgi:hypothetical protein
LPVPPKNILIYPSQAIPKQMALKQQGQSLVLSSYGNRLIIRKQIPVYMCKGRGREAPIHRTSKQDDRVAPNSSIEGPRWVLWRVYQEWIVSRPWPAH